MTPEQITELRHSINRSKSGLAKVLGVSRMTIHRWEKGLVDPSQEHAAKLERLKAFIEKRREGGAE